MSFVKFDCIVAATRFHRLAAVAAANGGFWVSAGGGTANVVAGEISRATGASFDEAMAALNETGGRRVVFPPRRRPAVALGRLAR